MTANLANMFTTADAGYKIMDGLVPDIGKYRDAMRQTSLADIFNNSVETFNEVMARPTDLVWDNDNGQFQERKTNRP